MRAAHARLATAAVVLAAMLAVAACGSSDDTTTGPKALDLKIGNLITTVGLLQEFGEPSKQAAEMAVDEIRKQAAQVRAQHRVTVTNADFKSDPKAALDQSMKLVESGHSCLVGPWGGAVTQRVLKQVAVPRKVVEIAPSTSGDAFTKAEDRGYFFRTVPPDKLQADALAELLDERLRGARGKTVNVGALKSTYGNDLLAAFDDAWTGKGGRINAKETYRADQPTFQESVQALAEGSPDAWVFFDFADTYSRIANDLVARSEAKFRPRKAFGTDGLANPRLPNIAPMASDGLRGVGIGAPKEGQAAKEFDKRFKARGGKRQTFDAQEFDAVVLCYLSAVAAGSTSGEKMKDKVREVSAPPGRKYTWLQLGEAVKALQAGQDIDYDGASGPIDLNEAGDPTAGVYDVWEFKRGKLRTGEQIAVPERPGGI